ncbi:hypothetical protein [Helicobacter marmotae]|uniref:hypothetical protein n=1 Tax=Helicobacter marmotae TaxID=152490 RepID=UPI0013155754|nr:hypothetical protein [Helicobacter marmotae]
MTMNPAFTPNPKSNDSQKAHKDSSPLAGVRDAKIISLVGSQVCHSEPLGEESLKELLVAHVNSSAFVKPKT